MSVHLRWGQCCDVHGCLRPARFGSLCAPCFHGGTPAERSVALTQQTPALMPDATVDAGGVDWLRALWAV